MNKFPPIVLLLACSSAAHALPIYSYTTDNLEGDLLSTTPKGGVNSKAGDVFSLDTSYDVGEQIFTWNYKARPGKHGKVNDGFWLVVSDGPNPKGDVDEYAILYGDLNEARITAYVYSGQNNKNSYKNSGNFLESFENAIASSEDSGVTSVSISISTDHINNYFPGNANWDGLAFGNEIGIWFHPTANSMFSYGTYGHLESFSAHTNGWYDTRAALLTTVPEPATIALLSIGVFAGFGVFWRRRGSNGGDLRGKPIASND